MSRRWIIWSLGLLALAIIALFPLRVALGLIDIERTGLTARAVAGPVWSGAIGDLRLGEQSLGSFEVGLDPLAALTGRTDLRFERFNDPEGPLFGTLRSGKRGNGIVDTSGRLAAASLFAPLPVDTIDLANATVLFADGRCVAASGRLTSSVNTRIAGLDLSRGLEGALSCEGERVRVAMVSKSRMERIDLTIAANGDYRAWMRISAEAPDLAAALMLLGFRPSGGGMGLTVSGRF